MRRNLVIKQLGISLGSFRRNLSGCRPLSDTAADILGDGEPARLDIVALADAGDQFMKLRLRLALRALEAVPALLSLTGFRRLVDDDGPMARRPFADVPLHLDFSSDGRLRFDLSNMTLASSRPRSLGCSSMTLPKSLITVIPAVPAIIRCAAVRTASVFS